MRVSLITCVHKSKHHLFLNAHWAAVSKNTRGDDLTSGVLCKFRGRIFQNASVQILNRWSFELRVEIHIFLMRVKSPASIKAKNRLCHSCRLFTCWKVFFFWLLLLSSLLKCPEAGAVQVPGPKRSKFTQRQWCPLWVSCGQENKKKRGEELVWTNYRSVLW